MATVRGVRRPRRPSIPSVKSMRPTKSGVGNAFLDQRLTPKNSTRSADFGGEGLPRAKAPIVLPESGARPSDVAKRAQQKRGANLRRTAANITKGYVRPGTPPHLQPLPVLNAQQLYDETEVDPDAPASEQLFAKSDTEQPEYQFPQVSPTKTINPIRPRTLEAGYEPQTGGPGRGTLRVRFRDGTPWEYYEVPPDVWQRFKRSASPGRFINRILNAYPYARGNF